jgi:hypothetical protein
VGAQPDYAKRAQASLPHIRPLSGKTGYADVLETD